MMMSAHKNLFLVVVVKSKPFYYIHTNALIHYTGRSPYTPQLKRTSKNKKQERKWVSTSGSLRKKHIVSRNVLRIKQCLIRETCFQQNMCETADQQSISSHMVVYMISNLVVYVSLYPQKVSLINVSTIFCLPCALSQNRSL